MPFGRIPHFFLGGLVSLFVLPVFQVAWQKAGAPKTPLADRRDAFVFLADHRSRLPGPVFVEVPLGAETNGDWRRIIELTEPYCGCKNRRALFPEKGRIRFASNNPPLTLPLTLELGAENQRAIAFMPHGGDFDSAYVIWRFSGGMLLADEWPSFQEHPQRYLQYNMELAMYAPGRFRRPYTAVTREVYQYGELLCTVPVRRDVFVPVCSIVRVTAVGESDKLFTVTFEVDASVKALKLTDYRPQASHVCTE